MQPYNPYQAPTAPAVGAPVGDRAYVRDVAVYQKGILLCIAASICIWGLRIGAPYALGFVNQRMATFFTVLQWIVAIVSAYFVFRLAQRVYKIGLAVVLVVLNFVPVVGFVTLVVLNRKATGILRRAGLRVGLLGVDIGQLE